MRQITREEFEMFSDMFVDLIDAKISQTKNVSELNEIWKIIKQCYDADLIYKDMMETYRYLENPIEEFSGYVNSSALIQAAIINELVLIHGGGVIRSKMDPIIKAMEKGDPSFLETLLSDPSSFKPKKTPTEMYILFDNALDNLFNWWFSKIGMDAPDADYIYMSEVLNAIMKYKSKMGFESIINKFLGK